MKFLLLCTLIGLAVVHVVNCNVHIKFQRQSIQKAAYMSFGIGKHTGKKELVTVNGIIIQYNIAQTHLDYCPQFK